jgi:hypothetical protein
MFTYILLATPDLAQCLARNDIPRKKKVVMKRLLSSQILKGSRPNMIFNVPARYAVSDSEFVSNLRLICRLKQIAGYVQSNEQLE